MREREDANRTRVAGHLDAIQGVVANTLSLYRNGAVGFIDWLDVVRSTRTDVVWNLLPISEQLQSLATCAMRATRLRLHSATARTETRLMIWSEPPAAEDELRNIYDDERQR